MLPSLGFQRIDGETIYFQQCCQLDIHCTTRVQCVSNQSTPGVRIPRSTILSPVLFFNTEKKSGKKTPEKHGINPGGKLCVLTLPRARPPRPGALHFHGGCAPRCSPPPGGSGKCLVTQRLYVRPRSTRERFPKQFNAPMPNNST